MAYAWMGGSVLVALQRIPVISLASGVLLSVAMISFYEGIDLTTTSAAASLLLLSSLFSTVFAVLFLGESLGYFEGLGAVFLVASYFFMSRTSVHCH